MKLLPELFRSALKTKFWLLARCPVANGLPRALTHSICNIQGATGGDGAVEKCLGRKGSPLLHPTPLRKAVCPLPKPLNEACFLFLSFLFMGKKEHSTVMQTGKDCSPEKCDYFLLIITEKTSNLSIYKSLEENAIQILKLDPSSWSLAPFHLEVKVINQEFLNG